MGDVGGGWSGGVVEWWIGGLEICSRVMMKDDFDAAYLID